MIRLFFVLLAIVFAAQADAASTSVSVPQKLQTLTQPGDADYTITVADTQLLTTTLTATRTWTLPAASTVAYGSVKIVNDLGGQIARPGNNIIIAPNGSDTINGRASYVLGCTYGAVTLMSNGSNGWQATAEACDRPNAANATALNQFGVSQGPLALLKMSPLPTGAPGAGVGWIALTKGTNAGTCKLVAYAGLSSTATTILDNIGGGGLTQGGC